MNKPAPHERRRLKRHNVSYYLPVMDRNSGQVIGHMVDISPVGFMMDCKAPIPSNKKYDLHLDFMEDIAGHAFFDFSAYSKWCRHDSIQPYLFNAGFEITDLARADLEVIRSIMDKYGEE